MTVPVNRRVETEAIVKAYQQTGSIWKAGKVVGLCGQSVWERLKNLGYPMPKQPWSEEELRELRLLAANCTIGQIATRLGRPYMGVAIKLSRLSIGVRFGNRLPQKVKRGEGYTKKNAAKWAKQLTQSGSSLRGFARHHHLSLENLVRCLQQHEDYWWRVYCQQHAIASERECVYCGIPFFPLSKKQRSCTRRCQELMRRDLAYFGGRRREAIGLSDGVCQLCGKHKPKGLSAHHVIGKQNDPNNELLVALCPGCHQTVGRIASMNAADDTQFWENLISLVLARRLGEVRNTTEHVGTHVCVDIEYLKADDLLDEAS